MAKRGMEGMGRANDSGNVGCGEWGAGCVYGLVDWWYFGIDAVKSGGDKDARGACCRRHGCNLKRSG